VRELDLSLRGVFARRGRAQGL